ncbi:unnamed protein product [Pieris macdunnoughi]|uniref:Reverse transcriptase domain-containing protein n=1 Tax=Pieris macdunnoughi TaxID=345717 RepID=A0A821QX66_9NEOP|nr:unnamed protein product [Pieris macdunnoughi]
MQANVQRSALATEELIIEAKKQRISILLVQEPYIGAKYLEAVNKSKLESWKSFCEKQDGESLWDGIYRVIRRTNVKNTDQQLVKDGVTLSYQDSAHYLAETFFPEDTSARETFWHTELRRKAKMIEESDHDDTHDLPFTRKELAECARSFNPKKAPGGDGLTSDICGEAIFADPAVFLALANRCLDLGYFPRICKKATVIILKKPGKENYSQPKSYRPIGLLPVLGKITEKMMVKRLNWHLVPRFSLKQYGFMPQRGTEDALYALMEKNQVRPK